MAYQTGFQDMGPHQVKRAFFSSNSSPIAAVAAVTNKKIRVLYWCAGNNGTVITIKFQSASNDLTGAIPVIANTTLFSGYNPDGHFETNLGEALNIVLSGAQTIAGYLCYIEVGQG